MAIIEIDQYSGFCFGVTRAINMAEEQLADTGHLYCLGDIVHNSNEVERLKQEGLETITHEQLKELHDVNVLLRAHGEPPETYEIARRNNIKIIDATCPVVLKLQQRIKHTYNDEPNEPQIVIYGKRGHAEVNGLVGQTSGKALVIESVNEIDKIDFSRNVYLYSQTTKSVQELKKIIEAVKQRMTGGAELKIYDTICRSVANRIPQIREFATRHDLILFVCGSKSSNGKILFGECLDANPNSHLVSNESEINPQWLVGKKSIGICGATSTPMWLMNSVKSAIERIVCNEE
ncbi:MAG: 4-hydroxy-3-methylbut-2-enyl diphosphate reductase [Bacteroidales bacterium]|nr:4-hydroxy-3-methylbut-2-enyl diphosphate reductase [Bacteroidales bacterium]MDY2591348.1 4-hydroxy-3-methylbut-2-enyl diphosphate reductase [Sodaliphilus sp.]MDY3736482.1 4-hydroxy-3-methylbut-2-enyl diphosphate reductase [Sodaliphilus sp.]MDY5360985.1 4-hydroxy-3-methylbut-2-enyl diphosphate reductase [Sodaliphilus sp.]